MRCKTQQENNSRNETAKEQADTRLLKKRKQSRPGWSKGSGWNGGVPGRLAVRVRRLRRVRLSQVGYFRRSGLAALDQIDGESIGRLLEGGPGKSTRRPSRVLLGRLRLLWKAEQDRRRTLVLASYSRVLLEGMVRKSLRLELRRRLGTEKTEVEPKQLEHLPDFQKKKSRWMESTER
jgi:hypothetical protein